MKPITMLGLLYRLATPYALAVIATSPSLAAPVTFAQYTQENGALQDWTISSNGAQTTISASGAVYFTFSGVSGLPFLGPQSAIFTLSATTNQSGNCGVACGNGDSFSQQGYSGRFSFIDTGSAPGTNLLSGVFAVTGSPATTGAQFSSNVGSSGGSFVASSTAGNLSQLVLTSNYLVFAGQTDETASWSLSSLTPNFAVGTVIDGNAFPAGAFAAAGLGTFSSNPGPELAEPPTFGLLGSGLLGFGFLLARKKSFAGKLPHLRNRI